MSAFSIKRVLTVWMAALLVLLSVSIAVAQSGGTGPDSPMAPAAGPQSLNRGQQVWYAFTVGGNEDALTEVRLSANPPGSATFSIWTQNNVQEWRNAVEVEPLGRGNAQVIDQGTNEERTLFGGDQVWAAHLDEAGTYLVRIEQQGDQAGTYRLTITGSDVSFPGGGTPQTMAAGEDVDLPAPETLPVLGTQATQQQAPAGAGPATAIALAGDQQTLGAGQDRWFSLRTAGRDYQTMIRMEAANPNAVEFTVWTQAALQNWINREGEEPTGRGTRQVINLGESDEQELYGGAPVWTGEFAGPEQYYVRVRNTGQENTSFRLVVDETVMADR